MKKIVGLALVLAIVFLGGYYVTGYIAENTVAQNVQAFNRLQGTEVLVIKNYHRGLFTSHAVLQWQFAMSEDPSGQRMQSELPLDIYHGPFIFSPYGMRMGLAAADSTLKIPKPYADKFKTSFTADSVQPELQLSLFINFMRKASMKVEILPFHLAMQKNKTTLQWDGFTAQTGVQHDFSVIDGMMQLKGFSAHQDQKSFTLDHFDANYHLNSSNPGAHGLYLGDARVGLQSVRVAEGKQVIFQLQQLDVRSEHHMQNHWFSASLETQLASVIAENKTFGPLKLVVKVDNLDPEALAKMRDIAKNATHMSSAIEKNKAMLGMLPEVPKLLSHGPVLAIPTFNITTPDGIIDGNMTLSIPENAGNNVFELAQKVKGNAHLAIPEMILKTMLGPIVLRENTATTPAANPAMMLAQGQAHTATLEEKLDNKLAAMVQSGLFVKKDKQYSLEVTLENMQLLINGKPFNPAMLSVF